MKPAKNEHDLIARIANGWPSATSTWLPLALGDDAALWRARPGHEVVLTCDWFLEGSHFLRHQHPADAVGWKCLARAVSDIAAMGGWPRCFLLGLAIPEVLTATWLGGFLRGLRRAAKAFDCQLAGGDTTRRETVLISITVIGEVPRGRAVLRSGARPNDFIFVSGTLGEAELGWRWLREGKRKKGNLGGVLQKHLYPKPRIALGHLLGSRGLASAMIDVSDGLSTDLARICEASGVGAQIVEGALPRPQAVPKQEGARLALHGGDDYELLFTVHPHQIRRLKRTLKNFRALPITRVGGITRSRKLLCLTDDGVARELLPGGWDPFRQSHRGAR